MIIFVALGADTSGNTKIWYTYVESVIEMGMKSR